MRSKSCELSRASNGPELPSISVMRLTSMEVPLIVANSLSKNFSLYGERRGALSIGCRFVTPKTESQQTLSALHRVRESLIRDRTKTTNQMHGFLLEFGINLPVGQSAIARLPAVLAEHSLPARLISILERLHAHFKSRGGPKLGRSHISLNFAEK